VLLAGHPYNTNCSILKPLDYDQTVASVSEWHANSAQENQSL
jgi:hypothetical protein